MHLTDEKKERLNRILFLFLILIAGISVVSKPTFDLYDRLSLYIMALFSACITVINFRLSKPYWIFVAVFSVYLIGSILYNRGGIGSVVTSVVSVFMLYSYFCFRPDRVSGLVLTVFSVAVVIFLCVLSYFYADNRNEILSHGINTNVLGMFLIYFFMIACCLMPVPAIAKRIAVPVLLIPAAVGLYHYSSRGSMLALALFLVLYLIPKKWMTAKTTVIAAGVVIVLGLLFPIVYLLLYRNGIQFQIFGKNLFTGRQEIWNNMFDLLNESPLNWLFGIGSHQTLRAEGSMNVHNNYFAVLVNSGVIGFVLYYGFLMTVFVRAARGIRKDSRIRCLLCMFIASALMLGFFEITTLWTTTYPFAFFSLGTAYGLAQHDRKTAEGSGT